jgi:hypothetical protein
VATERKRWFRVADKLGALALSNDELATWIRLLGHLNTRWARDGLTSMQARVAVVKPGTLVEWTGCGSVARALRILRALAAHDEREPWLILGRSGTYWRVEVPKFADFQCLASGSREDSGESGGEARPRKLPPPRPSPATRKKRERARAESPEPETPKDAFTIAAVEALPDSFFDLLRADRPDLAFVAPAARHVRAWGCMVVPKIAAAAKYHDLRKVLRGWFANATGDEIREAVERYDRAHRLRDRDPQSPEQRAPPTAAQAKLGALLTVGSTKGATA